MRTRVSLVDSRSQSALKCWEGELPLLPRGHQIQWEGDLPCLVRRSFVVVDEGEEAVQLVTISQMADDDRVPRF